MQISAVTPVQTPTLAERNANATAQTTAQAQAQTQAKSNDARDKKVEAEEAAKKVFTPAPPLRPNVQDYVDINRTLLALRKM